MKLNEKYSDADWHNDENTVEHHTDQYVRSDNSLVLRRGQPFKVRLQPTQGPTQYIQFSLQQD